MYDLHMRLEALGKYIIFYDMDDIFNIIPSKTVKLLEGKLEELFAAQRVINQTRDLLASDPLNAALQTDLATAVADGNRAIVELEVVTLEPLDLLRIYKGISEEDIRVSNRYYSQYGSCYSVENLAWSNDRLLNTCEEPL